MSNQIIIALVAAAALGCNFASRTLGGDMTVKLDCGQKVINVTWKGADFWALTRPMRADEVPETYLFSENAAFGLLNGSVTIVECRR